MPEKLSTLFGQAVRLRRHELMERAVRESEERFRTMANSIPQLAWMARADGFIFWYNQRWYNYTGTRPEQMEGWGWQSVHDPWAFRVRSRRQLLHRAHNFLQQLYCLAPELVGGEEKYSHYCNAA